MKRLMSIILALTVVLSVSGGAVAVNENKTAEGDISNVDIPDARIIMDDDSYDNVIVADAVVTDAFFGADPTGIKDSTEAIRKAVDYVSGKGGGTVYLPEGRYRVTGSITVDNYVTLMGCYQDPDTANGDYGTVIIADVAPSSEDLPGLFRLRGSSGVVGLTIWYAQQAIDDVRPFPYTFEIMGGANTIVEHMQFTIQNVTLLNSYRGVAASRTVNPNVAIGVQDAHENLVIENLKGTPLKCGIDSVNESDIGYFKNIHFSPKYWAEATVFRGPSEELIRAYTSQNGCGLMLGDLEWSPYYDITVEGYKTGVHIIKGTRIQEENPIAFMGGFYRLDISDCQYGLVVDWLYKGWGMLVTHSTIQGSEAAVVNNSPVGYVRLTDTEIQGAVFGKEIYTNTAQAPETQTETPDIVRPTKRLFNVVTDYDVKPDGHTECATQIQQALDDAKAAGGGIVYLPAGYYKISTALQVWDGVQLRGCVPIANRDTLGKSGGTVIFCYYDEDSDTAQTDQAFLTVGENAGVYGLRICYPDNNLWMTAPNTYVIDRTAFTIRLVGDGSYVWNVGLVNSYNGVSVQGNQTVIKNIPALFFNQGISVEGVDTCHIENVFSNATVATQSGYHSQFTDLFRNGWLWRINSLWNYYTYTETHTKMIDVTDSKNVNIMSVFTFCSSRILKATNSTVTMNGCGADRMWKEGLVVDALNSNVTLINQLKYHCMMFSIEGKSKLSIYGRMNLILGDAPSVHDVEYNLVENVAVKDTAVPETEGEKVTYDDDVLWTDQPSAKNPLTDLINALK